MGSRFLKIKTVESFLKVNVTWKNPVGKFRADGQNKKKENQRKMNDQQNTLPGRSIIPGLILIKRVKCQSNSEEHNRFTKIFPNE
jgi:hypothetical protein